MAIFRFPEKDFTTVLSTVSPLTNRLLAMREVSAESAEAFLNPNYETELHDPALLHDVQKAATHIAATIKAGERIGIFSDYDCDGIPGAVVLHDYFKAIEYSNFTNYIPHRHFEGFGLNKIAIDRLQADNVNLIITIDCGTSDVEAIEYANQKGMTVIVTDHHEPPEELPKAYAIVNPKLGDYPFKELCGAAVVYKLVQVLLATIPHSIPPGHEKWWLDMVGIATIADMVPLVGENRVFAHYGLTVLRKSRRPGLQQLLKKNRVDQRYLTEEDIGFTIGPRINAASRMDTPEDAFHLLASTEVADAGTRVEHLEKLNKERKTAVALITRELHGRLEKLETIPEVIVLGNPDWRPSLVGIAANKIAEEHQKPVFLWGRDGNGIFKGSCRSGGTTSVVTLMEAAKEIFQEYGGHHFSGGFSIKDENIFTFGDTLNQAFHDLGNAVSVVEELLIDEILTLDDVSYRLVKEIQQLAPFGTGNRKPLFAFQAVKPRKVEQFGKAKEHVKLTFETSGGALEGIAFFANENSFAKKPSHEYEQTIIAHVEQSFFMGRQQIRLRIVDVL